jgi:hypothetical protein
MDTFNLSLSSLKLLLCVLCLRNEVPPGLHDLLCIIWDENDSCRVEKYYTGGSSNYLFTHYQRVETHRSLAIPKKQHAYTYGTQCRLLKSKRTGCGANDNHLTHLIEKGKRLHLPKTQCSLQQNPLGTCAVACDCSRESVKILAGCPSQRTLRSSEALRSERPSQRR